ncbi:MAG: hypothetical protein AAF481_17675 [Acidobacteriota bacterium]
MRTFVTLRRLSVVFVVVALLTMPVGFAFADEAEAAGAQEDTSSVSLFVEIYEWLMERFGPTSDNERGPGLDPMGRSLS